MWLESTVGWWAVSLRFSAFQKVESDGWGERGVSYGIVGNCICNINKQLASGDPNDKGNVIIVKMEVLVTSLRSTEGAEGPTGGRAEDGVRSSEEEESGGRKGRNQRIDSRCPRSHCSRQQIQLTRRGKDGCCWCWKVVETRGLASSMQL